MYFAASVENSRTISPRSSSIWIKHHTSYLNIYVVIYIIQQEKIHYKVCSINNILDIFSRVIYSSEFNLNKDQKINNVIHH